jgi:hypothetical protein
LKCKAGVDRRISHFTKPYNDLETSGNPLSLAVMVMT